MRARDSTPSQIADMSKETYSRVRPPTCPEEWGENLFYWHNNITSGPYLRLYGKKNIPHRQGLGYWPATALFYSIFHYISPQKQEFPFPMINPFSILKEDPHGNVILYYFYFPLNIYITVVPRNSASSITASSITAVSIILCWIVLTKPWPVLHLVFWNRIGFANYVYHKTHFIPVIIWSASKW